MKGLRIPPGPAESKDPRAREYFDASLVEQLGPKNLGRRTLDVGSIGAGDKQTFTIAVPAARADEAQTVVVGVPSAFNQNVIPWAFVSADEVVTVVLWNPTAGSIDPAAATYTVRVFP